MLLEYRILIVRYKASMPYRRVVESVGNTGAWALFSFDPLLHADLKLNKEHRAVASLMARGEGEVE